VADRTQDECVVYDGYIGAQGYGVVYDPDRPSRRTKSHRVAFEAYYGPIREGAFILHSCDNRACINPHHLRQGTAQENKDDEMSRNRNFLASRDECPQGHPFDERNTYHYQQVIDGHIVRSRQCRTCNAANARRRRQKKREAIRGTNE
jgi:hypothetical protein